MLGPQAPLSPASDEAERDGADGHKLHSPQDTNVVKTSEISRMFIVIVKK